MAPQTTFWFRSIRPSSHNNHPPCFISKYAESWVVYQYQFLHNLHNPKALLCETPSRTSALAPMSLSDLKTALTQKHTTLWIVDLNQRSLQLDTTSWLPQHWIFPYQHSSKIHHHSSQVYTHLLCVIVTPIWAHHHQLQTFTIASCFDSNKQATMILETATTYHHYSIIQPCWFSLTLMTTLCFFWNSPLTGSISRTSTICC